MNAKPVDLPALLQSLLFVAGGPTDLPTLARATSLSEAQVQEGLLTLAAQLITGGLRLQFTGNAVQLVTAPEFTPYVERFLGLERDGRLTTASLETLAIIAYRQPVTRPAIEAIRGVNSDRAVATLRARELIEEAGQAETPGRPTLYRTTTRFLEYFGLERPEQLPPFPITHSEEQAVAL